MKTLLLTIALLCLGTSTSFALGFPGRTFLSVPYISKNDTVRIVDIYQPRSASGPTPVVMFIHGGGWSAGSLKSVGAGAARQATVDLLNSGVAVVSVEYRKAGNGLFIQDCIKDAKDACRFITKNAKKYNIDPSRMAMFGESAGGQMALTIALTSPNYVHFRGHSSLSSYNNFKILGCAAYFSPVSFRTNSDADFWGSDRKLSTYDNRIFGDETNVRNQNTARAIVSPIRYYSTRSCPLYLVHGQEDQNIPIAHMYGMRDQANSVNNKDFSLLAVRNADHNFRSYKGRTVSPSKTTIGKRTAAKLLEYLQ